ncbi:MAG: BadF/BadG/BcrA/BcrD ATPase family protein [Eubacteriales bacterium]
MKYCIGIDGGGSKTLAYLGDMKGNVLNKKNFGPSNYQIIGKESTKLVFSEVIDFFKKENSIGGNDLKFISAGIAGLDREGDRKVLQSIFDSMNLSCDVLLKNDSYTSLAGGLDYQNGLIVASGTGSVAVGKKDSNYHRMGGWTHVLGDEGSGYNIGLNALKMIMKIYDGRFEKTKLYYELLTHIKIKDPRDTITYAYDKVHNTREIASLAPLVFKHLKEKDSLSLFLVNKAVDDLFNLVCPLIGKLYCSDEAFLFTYSGSIILRCDYIKDNLIKKLQEIYPNMSPVDPIYNSAIGALIIGWSKYSIDYKENLKNSWKI